MKFKLEIDMGNAAFDTPETANGDKARSGIEVWNILNKLAKTIYNFFSLERGDDGIIYDSNGNKVGTWGVEE